LPTHVVGVDADAPKTRLGDSKPPVNS